MRASAVGIVAAAAVPGALAQQGAYAQCGGIGFTGGTTCVSGYACKYQNDWYSQCLPGTESAITTSTQANVPSSTSVVATTFQTSTKSAASSSSKVATTTSASTPTTAPSSGSLPWWFGINLSGAEFGEGNLPGTYGTDYIWYDKSSIDTFLSKGVNLFRINFRMERLTPSGMTGAFDANYLGNLTDTVNYITSKGAYAMIQPHNYGRFFNNIITDTAAFGTWWKNVAAQYKNNNLVVFDTNNEYHDMDQQLVFNLNQAAIDNIRAAGATSQYITPEGNAWSGAWSWVSSGNGASLVSLKDPSDSTGSKIIYQMHQYLDSDSSGSVSDCVSTTIFKERLQAATEWLRANGKVGFIGEYAGGSNAQCIAALQGGLQYLKDNKDVWNGHAWWAAGPWWNNYIYNMEPPSGIAYQSVLPSLMQYI